MQSGPASCQGQRLGVGSHLEATLTQRFAMISVYKERKIVTLGLVV